MITIKEMPKDESSTFRKKNCLESDSTDLSVNTKPWEICDGTPNRRMIQYNQIVIRYYTSMIILIC
jgi:hypothetical protein